MKIRPLPDLDLARIAPLPGDEKRRALQQLKLGRPPYSYGPMRKCILDILNVQAGPLASVTRTPWRLVEASIRGIARWDAELDANLLVAKALYEFADQHQIAGRWQEFYPLLVGVSERVTFWSPAVVAVDGHAVVPFIDPRQSKKLTRNGRRFVFSAMHERIRAADPDYADVGLAIIQFSPAVEETRIPKLHLDNGIDLIDFDTLDRMVRETYELWAEVLEERQAEARRGTGTSGSLL